ncbi:UNVERIFIED_CONTAM: hypothetical protein Slati_0087800 [Sesamum latifolium]|uniref:Aminotransferase-like plant mobile domain-containing protein n=1 Tax=Sesamum latifolium TaxID=2727402 RepID=A0AAW2Y842_9LAMI
MDQVQVNNDRFLPAAPYGAIWNCRHNFTWTVRATVRVIRYILDNMQDDQFIWQPYNMDSDCIMAYAADFTPELWRSACHLIFYAFVKIHHPERVLRQFGMRQNIPEMPDSRDMTLHKISHKARTGTDWDKTYRMWYWEWYNNITCRFTSSSTNRRVESGYQPGDSCMRDIVITMCLNRQQQDDWFQSAPYMPSHAESYSAHIDLDLGLGVNQPYAPKYNVSPIPFPSFSAYPDHVESSSATTSSRLHINDDDDDNEQNEPTQNMGEGGSGVGWRRRRRRGRGREEEDEEAEGEGGSGCRGGERRKRGRTDLSAAGGWGGGGRRHGSWCGREEAAVRGEEDGGGRAAEVVTVR